MSHDNKTGYKKPPEHTQFKPGQSGNPQGRRPQFGSFQADLLEALSAETSISENGNERKVTIQRAIIQTLVEAALQGNLRASSTLLAICARSSPAPAEPDPESTSDYDRDLLKKLKRRERRARTGKPNPPASAEGAKG